MSKDCSSCKQGPNIIVDPDGCGDCCEENGYADYMAENFSWEEIANKYRRGFKSQRHNMKKMAIELQRKHEKIKRQHAIIKDKDEKIANLKEEIKDKNKEIKELKK